MPLSPESSGDDATILAPDKRLLTLLPLGLGVIVVALVCLTMGADRLPLGVVWGVIRAHLHGSAFPDATADAVVWQLRLPRVALGLIAGGALAGSGVVYQAIFRNPMADPYIIGVSSGAALGAVIQMTVLRPAAEAASASGPWALAARAAPVLPFAMGIGAVLVVYRLALRSGRVNPTTLLLAGVAISSLLIAMMSLLLVVASRNGDRTMVIFWMLGGLEDHTWGEIATAAPWIIGGLTVAIAASRLLNVMLLGEETAQQLGISPEAVRRTLLAAATLATAAAVSVTGIIGFVGLIVPHLARLVWGSDNRALLPASILGGAGFLTLADAIARTILPSQEIPVGIVTALAGAPFFLALLRRRL